jgi:hypothetical protein
MPGFRMFSIPIPLILSSGDARKFVSIFLKIDHPIFKLPYLDEPPPFLCFAPRIRIRRAKIFERGHDFFGRCSQDVTHERRIHFNDARRSNVRQAVRPNGKDMLARPDHRSGIKSLKYFAESSAHRRKTAVHLASIRAACFREIRFRLRDGSTFTGGPVKACRTRIAPFLKNLNIGNPCVDELP